MSLPGRRPKGERTDVVALVRELGALMSELALSEIEVERGGLRLRMQRAHPPLPAPPAVSPSVAAASLPPAETRVASHVTIEAPMVGTFYRASAPTAEPYVGDGDLVKQGQVLCIIEAMKLMNEIESKVAGRIVKILVENGQPVEYGQPLFVIDANG